LHGPTYSSVLSYLLLFLFSFSASLFLLLSVCFAFDMVTAVCQFRLLHGSDTRRHEYPSDQRILFCYCYYNSDTGFASACYSCARIPALSSPETRLLPFPC
jgi:hypothetical protein